MLGKLLCKLGKHEDIWLRHEDWHRTGMISVCSRCHKGWTAGGWKVPNGWEQIFPRQGEASDE